MKPHKNNLNLINSENVVFKSTTALRNPTFSVYHKQVTCDKIALKDSSAQDQVMKDCSKFLRAHEANSD